MGSNKVRPACEGSTDVVPKDPTHRVLVERLETDLEIVEVRPFERSCFLFETHLSIFASITSFLNRMTRHQRSADATVRLRPSSSPIMSGPIIDERVDVSATRFLF